VSAPTSAAGEWLGIEVASMLDGQAVLEMPTRPQMGNRAQVVHGGFIALLADSAMGRAMSTLLREGERQFSFDLKMNFIATGRIDERLRAVARVLHRGHRTGVAECRVEGEDGRLVATATATFIVFVPSKDS